MLPRVGGSFDIGESSCKVENLAAARRREREPLLKSRTYTQPNGSSIRDDAVLASYPPIVGSFSTRDSAYKVDDLRAA